MNKADKKKQRSVLVQLPFGLLNAPAVFQELLSVVLQGRGDLAIAKLDDILVSSPTLERSFETFEHDL